MVLSTTQSCGPEDQSLNGLFEPVSIGGLVSANRLVCSPISINLAETDGRVSDDIIRFYGTMAETGVGLVSIGASAVSVEGGSTANGMHIGPAKYEEGLKRLADAIRAKGALSSAQIFHVGAQGNTDYTGQPVLGPSAYTCPDIGIEARPLEIPEIERIEDDFAAAILSGLRSGFDFVEVHVAHGYLLHQFLSPFFNRRNDAYGGSDENRLRIIRQIADKITARQSDAFKRVGFRISGGDFTDDGMTIERNRAFVEMMENLGAAYWVVSGGIYETAPQKYEHMKNGGYYRWAAELKAFASAPVVAQGGIRDLRQALDIVSAGQGDLVGMAQALLADPDIIKKTFYGQESKIIPCLECSRCRYIKRADLTFDCVRPDGYHPGNKKWELTVPD
jgi:2,4-dienoyl-CoA reductase-like NADH-dependent reductase (Old Yellow Enzyme family)